MDDDKRDREERMDVRLPHAKPDNQSHEIEQYIDSFLKNNKHVYLMTDLHLWKKNKSKEGHFKPSPNFDKIINNIKSINDEDLLIILGDLVDGEYTDKETLKAILKTFPTNMILVRGNNDLFNKQFYHNCGFKYVVDAFTWHDILFSHFPLENNNRINVHGHIHGYRTYWIPYQNHVDVAAYGGREYPVDMGRIIDAQPSYKYTIKEDIHIEAFMLQIYENQDLYD